MIKTLKFKLYQHKKNSSLNEQTKICGNIYNHCITLKRRYYKIFKKSLSKNRLQKHITKLKRKPKYDFWNKVGSQAIQDVTDRIERGYNLFFNNCKKKKKKRKVSPPGYKKVQEYKSVTYKQAGYKLLPSTKKYGQIKIGKQIFRYCKSREIPIGGKIKCVTVKKDKLGDWYIYLVCDIETTQKDSKSISKTGKAAGFDFGCTTFLTLTDSDENKEKIESPLFFKQNRKKVKKANRSLSRKQEGSNHRKQAKKNLARVHKKIVNQRKDYQFKLASRLVDEYDVLFFETLNLQEMAKQHGKKISDLAFYEFKLILQYYAMQQGKTVHYIDQWFPSTKLCRNCGYINNELTLKDRKWICPKCNSEHDRDYNASGNVIDKGCEELNLNFKPVRALTGRQENVSLGEFRAALVIA